MTICVQSDEKTVFFFAKGKDTTAAFYNKVMIIKSSRNTPLCSGN
ncbi:hypothetical protein HMPREF1141_2733 [Clostridium sp. MSTE9]|nr:hypothetical protein HMPREF1141_2733 [Clostridium sp. MSTE9]